MNVLIFSYLYFFFYFSNDLFDWNQQPVRKEGRLRTTIKRLLVFVGRGWFRGRGRDFLGIDATKMSTPDLAQKLARKQLLDLIFKSSLKVIIIVANTILALNFIAKFPC